MLALAVKLRPICPGEERHIGDDLCPMPGIVVVDVGIRFDIDGISEQRGEL